MDNAVQLRHGSGNRRFDGIKPLSVFPPFLLRYQERIGGQNGDIQFFSVSRLAFPLPVRENFMVLTRESITPFPSFMK